jgi:membrane-bound lytic murein transglycosylase F
MKKAVIHFFSVITILLFGVQCTFLEEKLGKIFDQPSYVLDYEGIKSRGFIRAAVDENSTSYYIYRGRRMGYEYELLRDMGKKLGVQVEFIVLSDIEKAFHYLEQGKIDLIAMNLEANESREKRAAFTVPLGTMSTVLVGNKSNGKLTSWKDLDGDSIFVRNGAVYKNQLCAIRDSLGIDFVIFDTPEHEERLIDQLAEGKIKWTVADKNIAQANATYYENLTTSWTVSDQGNVAWAVRKNSPSLKDSLDTWLQEKQKRFIPDLYSKYFLNPKNSYFRTNSAYSSLGGNRISSFDELIQEGAKELGWDWRLLAALVYKESAFDTSATSYAGASGLFQLMPVTLERFGVTDPSNPQQSMMGGVKYLKYLDKFWRERVPDAKERIKFILASYNIGQGHVEDAWRLTLKYGRNTQNWKDVSIFLELKTDPEYYRDPVVKSGFAKGHIAVNYVRDILSLYASYKTLVSA